MLFSYALPTPFLLFSFVLLEMHRKSNLEPISSALQPLLAWILIAENDRGFSTFESWIEENRMGRQLFLS